MDTRESTREGRARDRWQNLIIGDGRRSKKIWEWFNNRDRYGVWHYKSRVERKINIDTRYTRNNVGNIKHERKA
jgi:hypothetical protein